MMFRGLTAALVLSMSLASVAKADATSEDLALCSDYAPSGVCESGNASLFSAEIRFPDGFCLNIDNSGFIATAKYTTALIFLTLDNGEIIDLPVNVATSGLGARLMLGFGQDCSADLNGVTGMMSDGKISSIFGSYYGLNADAAIIAGLGLSAVANSSGIWIGSSSADIGLGINLSGVRVRITPRDRLPRSLMNIQLQ